jgi:hypothetical protein
MKKVVISPKNETEYKFINNLLKKLGINSVSVSDEFIEDLGLSMMLKKTNKQKRVSKNHILKKLMS